MAKTANLKKVFSLLLALIMSLSVFTYSPAASYAAQQTGTVSGTIKNPLYYGSRHTLRRKKYLSSSVTFDDSVKDGVRNAMAQRQFFHEVYISGREHTDSEIESALADLVTGASIGNYTKSNVDGDYIDFQWSAVNYKTYYAQGGYDVYLYFSYYADGDEELAVNNAVSAFFSQVDMTDISDYELLKKIHDYVVKSCTYNDEDIENEYNYSAYGALCAGKAVCQGYALAFYRLCKEAGFDVRIVTSDPNEGQHGWNIVKLGGKCYYVDCTWDDNDSETPLNYYFLVDYATLKSLDDDDKNQHTYYTLQSDYSYLYTNYYSKVPSASWASSAKNISNCKINTADLNNIKVTAADGTALTKGTDYTVTLSGESVTVTGKGSYSGTSTRKARITAATSAATGSEAYCYDYITPSLNVNNLTEGTDYITYYYNNYYPGTATAVAYGIGNYTGFASATFTVGKRDINLESSDTSVSYTGAYYTGSALTPSVYIDGLEQGTDYTVSYANNIEPGTGYIYITGIGDYTSTAVRTFSIYALDIAAKSMSTEKSSYAYTGKAVTPKVTVDGCTQGVDYTVTYSSNVNKGTGYATVTGVGHYGGSKTISFKITAPSKPKKVTLKKLKTSKKSVTVSWKKISCSGYQIEYSTNKSFKKSKKVFCKSSKTTSKKIKKLKKGKKYYFRVRAYKTVNGKKTYGSWSAKKSIKCK